MNDPALVFRDIWFNDLSFIFEDNSPSYTEGVRRVSTAAYFYRHYQFFFLFFPSSNFPVPTQLPLIDPGHPLPMFWVSFYILFFFYPSRWISLFLPVNFDCLKLIVEKNLGIKAAGYCLWGTIEKRGWGGQIGSEALNNAANCTTPLIQDTA